MSEERLKLPPERGLGFHQRRKRDKWRVVAPPAPALEASVADSHAHLHLLPDPAWELVRCAANGVRFACEIVDPSEDDVVPFDTVQSWLAEARGMLHTAEDAAGLGMEDADVSASDLAARLPEVQVAAGVHPHNARLYDAKMERRLRKHLEYALVVGEIGLDYHYDLSPRDVQRDVFRRQVRLALELNKPVALHLRDGEGAASNATASAASDDAAQVAAKPADGAATDGGATSADAVGGGASAGAVWGGAPVDVVAANGGTADGEGTASGEGTAPGEGTADGGAHREAFDILHEEGILGERVLLHCCTLGPEELKPWIEAGCYIAYGGALTFKSADAIRAGARLVPEDRLLLETDSPYMTPEPMRGAACTPAHAIFTAERLAEVRGKMPGLERERFLEQLNRNARRFFHGDC